MYDLTGFQRDLLWVIAEMDDPKGLDIKEELEEYYNSEINHGQHYPNLDELADKGLIKKGNRDQRTNYYRLSGRGRSELRRRHRWEAEKAEAVL
ncbi:MULTISPECIES: helix-turn-helix transcriptional regulator [unclassified Haloferax]|jgi:DNA-binding PadR family transcriptional regulator|uniref:helix-turn-helix transcriptional regulator n=1 Tax=unclassified Haloferax TaxID=2625095 RepID=UPI0028767B26|nr:MULTISPECIES: helix-turn-helix transcriptional regulator [unclassified Haloferax]MDS0243101.1 PadR family transcriptional regulator [Haloferax sp. S2CR25]MDS0446222.1 PadR family transcriptional regulator [Haloferax sp. S2CR25-2]